MTTAIATLQFEAFDLRFVGTADKPEWVAADVVSILYADAHAKDRSNYLKKVPSEWKGMKQIHTPGGNQEMVTLYEPGLYHLICRSDSLLAVPFQRWVFEEVLPSIRKTGIYSVQPQDPFAHPDVQALLELMMNADLKLSELRRLCLLYRMRSETDPFTYAKLGARLNIARGTVSRAVKRLEAAGLASVQPRVLCIRVLDGQERSQQGGKLCL